MTLLAVEHLKKTYARGWPRRRVTFTRRVASRTLDEASRRSVSAPIMSGNAHATRTRIWRRGVPHVYRHPAARCPAARSRYWRKSG